MPRTINLLRIQLENHNIKMFKSKKIINRQAVNSIRYTIESKIWEALEVPIIVGRINRQIRTQLYLKADTL